MFRSTEENRNKKSKTDLKGLIFGSDIQVSLKFLVSTFEILQILHFQENVLSQS